MLSVIIISKNEALNIRRCLESVKWADEIVLVDSGSTDNTLAIAKEYTDKITVRADWQGYGIQKQRALELASGDWILNLDADESVCPALKVEIEKAIQSNTADAYRVPVYLNFYGSALSHSWSPKRHIRLFKREGARYSDKIVHEGVIVSEKARIGQLKQGLEHHSFRDFSHALYKLNRYSSYSAKIRIAERKRPSLLKIVLSSIAMFLRCYILQGGFLEGKRGFLLAVLSSHGSFYRGVKTMYQDKNSNLDLPPL